MIVSTEDLPRYRRRVSMVDGAFDPIHPGHIAYFEAAAGLGAPVLCNVSSDEYVARKHEPFLSQEERAAVLDSIRWIDYIHISRTSTNEVLRRLEPRSYVKGADWEGRLPEEELVTCTELGIAVVYLDTVLGSSTAIIDRFARRRRPTG
jgi:cytidyltransferase-like protein